MNKTILKIVLVFCVVLVWTSCKEEDDATNQNENACATFTDSRDGETYLVVTIGEQCWMAENLRYIANGSWLNPDNPSVSYGRLYDWTALMNEETSSNSNPSGVQGICPTGWHLHSDEEWVELSNTVVGLDNGSRLKSISG